MSLKNEIKFEVSSLKQTMGKHLQRNIVFDTLQVHYV